VFAIVHNSLSIYIRCFVYLTVCLFVCLDLENGMGDCLQIFRAAQGRKNRGSWVGGQKIYTVCFPLHRRRHTGQLGSHSLQPWAALATGWPWYWRRYTLCCVIEWSHPQWRGATCYTSERWGCGWRLMQCPAGFCSRIWLYVCLCVYVLKAGALVGWKVRRDCLHNAQLGEQNG